MFSEEKLSQTRQKKGNISFGFEFFKKNCISKLLIKMIIKREITTGKVYAYLRVLRRR